MITIDENMLVFFLLVFAFILLYMAIKARITRKTSFFIPDDSNQESVKKVNQNVNQIRPRYHGYHGGFTSITKCSVCTRTAIREDQHPVDPCPECGGRVREDGAGKWDGTQWIKPKQDGEENINP